jgi:hypothetical protein
VTVMDSQRTQIRFWMNFRRCHQCPALPASRPSLASTKFQFERLQAKPGFPHSTPLRGHPSGSGRPPPAFFVRLCSCGRICRRGLCGAPALEYTFFVANYLSA